MRGLSLCLLALLFSVYACSDKQYIPADVIPKEKMEKVMWDMIVADRYSALFLAKDSAKINVKTETLKLYEQVFQINKISKEEFLKSFNFYLSRPDIGKVIFDSLAVRTARQRPGMYTTPQLNSNPNQAPLK